MRIRPERENELPKIDELVRIAFETAEVSDGDEQDFVDRLRRGGEYVPELALVVEDENDLIAYIMLTRIVVSSNDERHPVLLLAALAVVLERRAQGVGTGLVDAAFRRARELGHAAVVVVGDPAYYSRFGFRRCAEFGIANANGIEDEFFMARELEPGGLSAVRGTISLPA